MTTSEIDDLAARRLAVQLVCQLPDDRTLAVRVVGDLSCEEVRPRRAVAPGSR